uniref:Uncharacterized protein n=1 Tax=Vannella robusta TaxID=1487602 RepID=A0A7S4ISC0_9EUKA|mmetsp:Transcript_7769/g.9626  ORF Transcript_7769/g.9626 Transcript_7769/m.9626 type:complete len:171 (+) Transcript_7769:151-663(+)
MDLAVPRSVELAKHPLRQIVGLSSNGSPPTAHARNRSYSEALNVHPRTSDNDLQNKVKDSAAKVQLLKLKGVQIKEITEKMNAKIKALADEVSEELTRKNKLESDIGVAKKQREELKGSLKQVSLPKSIDVSARCRTRSTFHPETQHFLSYILSCFFSVLLMITLWELSI